MKKEISEKIRLIDESELTGENIGIELNDYQLKRIKNRTLEKTGLKAEERKTVMKKFSWKKVAAVAACLCIVVCAVVVCANVFGDRKAPIEHPDIRGDFMGLTMLKAYVSADDNADDFVYELALLENIDMPVENQIKAFEEMGIEAKRFPDLSDNAVRIYPTKAQVLSMELPEPLQFTWFNVLSENK